MTIGKEHPRSSEEPHQPEYKSRKRRFSLKPFARVTQHVASREAIALAK